MTKLTELERENAILKAQLETMERMMEKVLASNATKKFSATSDSASVAMRQMTPKQHAALQMVLRGASNDEIAKRFDVTPSTAKVYVKGIMDKMGVRNRPQIVSRSLNIMEQIDEEEYRVMSGGVPKDWDKNYTKYPAVNAMLFEKTRGKKT